VSQQIIIYRTDVNTFLALPQKTVCRHILIENFPCFGILQFVQAFLIHPEYTDIPDEFAVSIMRAAGSPEESVHITENIIVRISQSQSTPTCQ